MKIPFNTGSESRTRLWYDSYMVILLVYRTPTGRVGRRDVRGEQLHATALALRKKATLISAHCESRTSNKVR